MGNHSSSGWFALFVYGVIRKSAQQTRFTYGRLLHRRNYIGYETKLGYRDG